MHNDYNDFDKQLISALQDAEIRPSRRSWKKIAARLDAAAAPAEPAPRRSWYGYAAAGLAFAAVAVGAFLFTGNVSQEFKGAAPLVAQAVVETPLVLGDPSDLSLAEVYRAVKAEPVKVNEDEPAMEELPAATEASESAGIHETSTDPGQSAAPQPRTSNPPAEYYDDAVFAALDNEQSARRGFRMSSVYAKGALNGNDPRGMADRHFASMAPGTATGISELSSSSYGVPVTLGLGVQFQLLPRLSIGTGVDYSLLTRSFTGSYTSIGADGTASVSEASNVRHSLQYVGIPLNLYFNVLGSDRINFYVYAGGTAELCVGSRYTLFTSPRINYSESVEKPAFSVGGGLGVSFRLADFLSIYIDPGVRYYFNTDQPRSVRTDKPVMLSFDAGLRFNL